MWKIALPLAPQILPFTKFPSYGTCRRSIFGALATEMNYNAFQCKWLAIVFSTFQRDLSANNWKFIEKTRQEFEGRDLFWGPTQLELQTPVQTGADSSLQLTRQGKLLGDNTGIDVTCASSRMKNEVELGIFVHKCELTVLKCNLGWNWH